MPHIPKLRTHKNQPESAIIGRFLICCRPAGAVPLWGHGVDREGSGGGERDVDAAQG